MDRPQLLLRVDRAWIGFTDSYAGLSESDVLEPGVTKTWSVKDIIAHVTTWEEEALKHLPAVLEGRRPPRYSVAYGGIDAFNAQMLERIDGNVRSHYSFDSIKEEECLAASTTPPEMTDYLSMATEPGILLHELRLKENRLCSLMRNISLDSGLVKNAQVIV